MALSAKGMTRNEFLALYDERAEPLLGFFARRVGDPHTARDVWAETWAQAFAARRSFRGRGADEAASWLFGIAYRQLAALHRRGSVEQRALRRLALEAPALDDNDIERLIELGAAGDLLGAALDDLPVAQREALALRVVDELPYADVAAHLDITPIAARVRVSRALSALRATLATDRRTT